MTKKDDTPLVLRNLIFLFNIQLRYVLVRSFSTETISSHILFDIFDGYLSSQTATTVDYRRLRRFLCFAVGRNLRLLSRSNAQSSRALRPATQTHQRVQRQPDELGAAARAAGPLPAAAAQRRHRPHGERHSVDDGRRRRR